MGALSTVQRAIGGGLLVVAVILALWVARLDHLRAGYKADLTACQSGRSLDHANAATAAARAETGFVTRLHGATDAYADRSADRSPIIIRSTDTVREYAKTDAGRVLCRAADRVRAVDDLDADLARESRPAGGSVGALPRDSTASAGGR